MTFEEYMASIRDDVLKYRKMTNELAIKKEKSSEELNDYVNLNKQVLSKIRELENASDSEAKEELESWLKEESDYVTLIRTLSDNFMTINKEINDINNEHYNKIVMFLDLLDERDNIRREIFDIEKASFELNDNNYVACLDVDDKVKWIHPNLADRYSWLVSREKELNNDLYALSKEIYNGDQLEVSMEENSILSDLSDNASLNQKIVFYNNKINEILNAPGRKCYVKYNGKNFYIPRAKRGAFLSYMHKLDVLMKKNDDMNKQGPLDDKVTETKALVPYDHIADMGKILKITNKRKPGEKVVKKIKSFVKRKKTMIAAAIMTIVVVTNGLFSLPVNGVNQTKVNDTSINNISVSSQGNLNLFEDALPYDMPGLGDVDEIIESTKKENIENVKSKNDVQAKIDTNDIRIGSTVTVNDSSKIYVTSMDAINEINQYRPREENNGKDRVVMGVTIDVEGNRINLFANQKDVNSEINVLVNGGGKIVSVLTSIKDDLPNFVSGDVLSVDDINDKSEGFYNVNSVNMKEMERVHVR